MSPRANRVHATPAGVIAAFSEPSKLQHQRPSIERIGLEPFARAWRPQLSVERTEVLDFVKPTIRGAQQAPTPETIVRTARAECAITCGACLGKLPILVSPQPWPQLHFHLPSQLHFPPAFRLSRVVISTALAARRISIHRESRLTSDNTRQRWPTLCKGRPARSAACSSRSAYSPYSYSSTPSASRRRP